jgi:hypothetical protein
LRLHRQSATSIGKRGRLGTATGSMTVTDGLWVQASTLEPVKMLFPSKTGLCFVSPTERQTSPCGQGRLAGRVALREGGAWRLPSSEGLGGGFTCMRRVIEGSLPGKNTPVLNLSQISLAMGCCSCNNPHIRRNLWVNPPLTPPWREAVTRPLPATRPFPRRDPARKATLSAMPMSIIP